MKTVIIKVEIGNLYHEFEIEVPKWYNELDIDNMIKNELYIDYTIE